MNSARAAILLLLVGASFTARAAAQPFPPRNQCVDIPGHVRCITELGGLIHGASITTPTYSLTCRAFRRMWLQRFAHAEAREVVVAGVCEQHDLVGNLMTRWDTLAPLKTQNIRRSEWSSIQQSLPRELIELEMSVGNQFSIFSGYYLPEGWNGLGSVGVAPTAPLPPAIYDDFPRGGHIQIWAEEPARGESVESPRFRHRPRCSTGYVVCSAYLKILHPDRESREIHVEMVSARRFFSFAPGNAKFFEQQATFLRRKF